MFVNADQARICRTVLPALEEHGARIELTGTRRAPGGVRLDYASALPGGPARRRWAVCRFGPGPELSAITTDREEISGPRVFLLKRYYLDTPEGTAAAPGPADPTADLPNLPPWAAGLLQHAVAGGPSMAVYGLLASAYALVYGLVGRLHLTFGEIAAVAALAFAVLAVGGTALGVVAALVLGLGASAVHNAAAGQPALRLIAARRATVSLVATLAVSLALSEYLRLTLAAASTGTPAFAANPIPLARVGDAVVTATPAALLTGLTGLLAAGLLLAFLRRSHFGRAWRAQAGDPRAAALCGMERRRLLISTVALSVALAALAGALLALHSGAPGFGGGLALGLKALAGAILGGIGSVPGALLGGLAVGAFETVGSAYLPAGGRELALHLALIGAVLLRAAGGLGPASPRPI
ncbi:hypothetical protein [Enterovirga sp.]|uniref:ABC transporter permease subunit n=1 Tax=Enterovirga sp. TaxID=2026350 RepID=UPI0026143532|nr:hypothetical protein [Enterovirga sp.]MDB5589984.1 hypothetical protein [Enterovirga sp.]